MFMYSVYTLDRYVLYVGSGHASVVKDIYGKDECRECALVIVR